jgi:ATP-dependent RNA helicase HrpA
VHVPVQVLARLGGDEFAWHVPALREELITALIRSLPKELRRNFVPAPDTARAVLTSLDPGSGPLLDALQRELQRRSGILVPIDAFDLGKLPDHLRVTFAVESDDGTELARGKDLEALQEQLAAPVRDAVAEAFGGALERKGLRAWPDGIDELPRVVESAGGGRAVRGYPAFVDTGAAVDLRVFATPSEQAAAMGPGIRRLLRLSVSSPTKALEKQLDTRTRLTLGANPDGSLAALLDDCADAAVAALAPAPAWSRAEFNAVRDRVASGLAATTRDVLRRVERVLAALHEVQVALPATPPPAQAAAIADIRAQLAALLPAGFVSATGATHLLDLARYVTAIGRRLDRLPHAIAVDGDRMARVHVLADAYAELVAALSPSRAAADDVRDIGRLIEEFRVSLWAQQLGTARPVSEQRIYRAIDAVTAR